MSFPVFVCPGKNVRNPIVSMPGVAQQSVDTFLEECREVEQLGIPGIILFGIPEKKDATGTEAYAADGVVQRAIEAVRRAKLNLLVMTDVCLCEYTDHGHCGIVENGEVKNDPTLELLAAVESGELPMLAALADYWPKARRRKSYQERLAKVLDGLLADV